MDYNNEQNKNDDNDVDYNNNEHNNSIGDNIDNEVYYDCIDPQELNEILAKPGQAINTNPTVNNEQESQVPSKLEIKFEPNNKSGALSINNNPNDESQPNKDKLELSGYGL